MSPIVDDDFWDEIFGKPGTAARIRADAEIAELKRRHKRANAATAWLRHVPYVGKMAACFWYLCLTEESAHGVRDGMQFAYLNDGYRPTLWHTWLQMQTDDPEAPFAGIWPSGAPSSRRDAFARQTAAAIERAEAE